MTSGAFRQLRDAKGQALVEFALVLGPLLLVVFGLIDFGSIYFNMIGMRQGVSDGSRQAAVGQYGNSTCTLTGVPAGATTGVKDLMCLVHSLDGVNNDSTTRVAVIVGDSGTPTQTYAAGTPVTICEQYALSSLTGLFSPLIGGHIATSVVTSRIETTNAAKPLTSPLSWTSATVPKVTETALAGSSWSFCTAPAPYA